MNCIGSTHDLTAARADRIVNAATAADVKITADNGHQGASGTARAPIKRPAGKGHNDWEKQANSALAKLRAVAERPFAELKRWRVLNRLRNSSNHATDVLRALFTITRQRSSLARGQIGNAH